MKKLVLLGVGALASLAGLDARALPPGPTCATGTLITAGTHTGTNFGATGDGSSQCFGANIDVWYRYVAPAGVPLIEIDTCGSSFDTLLSVHPACPGSSTNQIVCNDNSGACGSGSFVKLLVNAGQTYYIRIGSRGDGQGSLVLHLVEKTGAADAYSGNLTQCEQVGRFGSEVAIATDSPICNAGDTPLDWFGAPVGAAPRTAFNMYRLHNDRIVQIGASWIKHSNGTSQDDDCGFGCAPYSTTQRLGAGCSDTYTVGINRRQFKFGPRAEVDPWTGAFTYAGSVVSLNSPGDNEVDRLNRVFDADLLASNFPGASYFVESLIQAHDDSDHTNSLSNRQVLLSGSAGGTWTTTLTGATSNGVVLGRWPGATVVGVPAQPFDDGRVYVGAKATPLGSNQYRFEYALFNLDSARGVRRFSIPLPADATISGVGSSSPRTLGEPGHNNAWSWSRQGEVLSWSTDAHEPTLNSNPIRWGTLHNFYFTATLASPPVLGQVRLFPYMPGSASVLLGVNVTPGSWCPADTDDGTGTGTPDGGVTVDDLLFFLARFDLGDTLADLDNGSGAGVPDGGVTIDDLVYFLTRFDAGC